MKSNLEEPFLTDEGSFETRLFQAYKIPLLLEEVSSLKNVIHFLYFGAEKTRSRLLFKVVCVSSREATKESLSTSCESGDASFAPFKVLVLFATAKSAEGRTGSGSIIMASRAEPAV